MYTPLGGKWVFKVSTFYAGDELLHYDAAFDSDGTGTSEDVSTQRSQASYAKRLDEQWRFQQILRLHGDVLNPTEYSDATKSAEACIDVQRVKATIEAPSSKDSWEILGILNIAPNGYCKVRFTSPPIGPQPAHAWVAPDAVTQQQLQAYEWKTHGLGNRAVNSRREIVARRNREEGSETDEENA